MSARWVGRWAYDMFTRSIPVILTGLLVASLLAAAPVTASEHGSSDELPATIYEDPAIPPQAMDYDEETKTFPAHPGWYQDKKIHYYKFQMYTPGSYPGQFGPGTDNTVSTVPLYIPTTLDNPLNATNPFNGIPEGQHPIVEQFPTKNNTDYSDFVRVNWVLVDSSYEANDYDSADDVQNGTVIESNIVANVPIVPMNSTLAHPTQDGDAPIDGLTVWYDGMEAQAFVFETNDQSFADHFNPKTRQGPAADAESGFEIVVNGDFVTATSDINPMPIWHVNQFWTGVETGVNHGGPSPNGQQNVISVDRLDDGYSPLWQVFWVTKAPVGYQADQASHHSQFSESNGFELVQTPMFVNCPNVGPHGGSDLNEDKADSFDANPEVQPGASFTLEGALIMPGGPTQVNATLNGEVIGSGETNPMGGYTIDLSADDLEPGENEITVSGPNGTSPDSVTWTVSLAEDTSQADDAADDNAADEAGDGMEGEEQTPFPGALIALAILGLAAIVRGLKP